MIDDKIMYNTIQVVEEEEDDDDEKKKKKKWIIELLSIFFTFCSPRAFSLWNKDSSSRKATNALSNFIFFYN